MNWDRIEGSWKQWSGKAKEQWGKLSDDTLTQVDGKRDQLVGKIQESYGISKDEAEHQVRDWSLALADRESEGQRQGQPGSGGQPPAEQSSARNKSTSQDWNRAGRDAAASVGRLAGGARNKAMQQTEALKAHIHEQPFGALAMAAGIGFILGLLVSRR